MKENINIELQNQNKLFELFKVKNTLPKDKAIKIQRHVHTGPKSHAGGDQEGLINFEYQL